MHYVLVLSEELNFRKAAKRLNMTQPPLSRQIKLLERELGVTLFNRDNRGVSITKQGEFFIKEAKKIHNRVMELKNGISKVSNHKPLKVGCMGFCSAVFIPDFVYEMTKLKREVKILEFSNNSKLIESLEENKIDIAFHYPMQNISDLIISKLVYSESLVVYMSKENILSKKENIEIEDLLTQEFILPFKNANPSLIKKFTYFTNELEIEPKICMELSNHQSRLEMVSKNMGITIDGISLSKLKFPNLIFKYIPELNKFKAQVHMAFSKELAIEFINDIEKFFLNYKNE